MFDLILDLRPEKAARSCSHKHLIKFEMFGAQFAATVFKHIIVCE